MDRKMEDHGEEKEVVCQTGREGTKEGASDRESERTSQKSGAQSVPWEIETMRPMLWFPVARAEGGYGEWKNVKTKREAKARSGRLEV